MSGKTVNLQRQTWYDEKSGYIKLAGKEFKTASGISNNPKSVRYHPDLYRKLATVLRNAGFSVPLSDD